jgi:transcriptional regulator with XRE-family HTH domain
VRRLAGELADARRAAGLSQETLAALVGLSQSDVSRFERLRRVDSVRFMDVAAMAAVLGLELGASLYPAGEPIRDKGHQALIGRFRAVLSAAWRVAAEVPLPLPGDRRAWDLLLRIPGQLVAIEAETRIPDIQAFVRRIRQRELEGGAEAIVIVLAESAINRHLLPQLLEALGPRYQTSSRALLKALRTGRPLPGSGVVLL